MTPDDSTSRILGALPHLGPDEQTVLAVVAERLVLGRRRYGELRLATDQRDWRREALEEAADGLVYVAAALVRGPRPVTVDLDARRPHRVGVAVCGQCQSRQVSVALADMDGPLECARCGAMASSFEETAR